QAQQYRRTSLRGRWLSEHSGEAVHLGIISGNEGIVLERVIGKAQIKFYTERGTRFPLHTSAPGIGAGRAKDLQLKNVRSPSHKINNVQKGE
ncbi:MAG: hypothetical protein WCK17_13985, partial [Verrucomicrobiota bacterium]